MAKKGKKSSSLCNGKIALLDYDCEYVICWKGILKELKKLAKKHKNRIPYGTAIRVLENNVMNLLAGIGLSGDKVIQKLILLEMADVLSSGHIRLKL